MAGKTTTTAATLISYRKELLAGDVPETLADEMVRDAASRIIQNQGLVVPDE
jgi:hypothetical protein